jgi:hypothetical protein
MEEPIMNENKIFLIKIITNLLSLFIYFKIFDDFTIYQHAIFLFYFSYKYVHVKNIFIKKFML